MRNFIYIILLIASSSIYAQTGIENDALYLKYEQEYLNLGTSKLGVTYEYANRDFYSQFQDYKVLHKFRGTKNKEKWLTKNFDKTNFKSADQALTAYNHLLDSKDALDKSIENMQQIRNELLKKYNENLIWETLQNRIKTKR